MSEEDINFLISIQDLEQPEFDNAYLERENERLRSQLQQKENIIKELNDKIEDDKMIIEGNWGCIDSLRKDYNLQKNIIKEVREYIEKNWISQKDADNYRFDDEELDIEISDIAVLFDILDKEVN